MRAFTWALVLCHICSAQVVKVRVINGYDGRPLPKQAVFVQFFYERRPKISPPLHIETDANGEAQFNISESPPENIDVRLALTYEHWHCACWVMADTEKILREGIVQVPPTNVPNAPIAPASMGPGQIVFIARPFTFFEKLLYPFLKQKLDVALPDFRLLPETTTRGPGLNLDLSCPPSRQHSFKLYLGRKEIPGTTRTPVFCGIVFDGDVPIRVCTKG
jgi:hypothetical protein